MGDSSTMTIEFLRARLLSERSVSKAAKERSDQLAKRVAELEEQLNVVTFQRKKAEKEAIEAFSILRSHGIDDFYETVGSSSDKDEGYSENEGNGTFREVEASKVLEKKELELEDTLSSSGPGFSTSQGRSLSWKGRSYSRDSEKKVNGRQIRQRMRRVSLMSSINTSPKYNLGKSCRKIKRRETGSTTEEEGENGLFLDDYKEAGAARSDCTDDQLNLSVDVTRSKQCQEDTPIEQYKLNPSAFGTGRDEEMERVLEQHANLIGRYEAEEKAQREWEEKYNENKITILDPVGVEECSNLAAHNNEPLDELTAIVPYKDKEAKSSSGVPSVDGEHISEVPIDELTAIVPYEDKEAKCSAGVSSSNREFTTGVRLIEPETLNESNSVASGRRQVEPVDFYNGLAQTRKTQESITEACWVALQRSKGNEGALIELALSAEGSTTSSPTANQNQDLQSESSSSSSFNIHSNAQRILNSSLSGNPLTSASQNGATRGHYSNHYPISKQSQTENGSLQSVLDALHRAKLSLRQELNKLPLASEGSWALTTVPRYDDRPTRPDKTVEVPIGSAGLFRLPTDTFPQAQNLKSYNYSTTSNYSQFGYINSIIDNCSTTTGYPNSGPGNSMSKYLESYRSEIPLPTTDRFSEPYSGLAAERSLLNNSGIPMGRQHFHFDASFEAKGTGASSSGFPIHTDTTREPSTFSTGFVDAKYNRHAENCRLGSEEPAFDIYSRPYADLPRERRLHDELPKRQIDWTSGMPSTERYSLYGSHGIQSDWRIR